MKKKVLAFLLSTTMLVAATLNVFAYELVEENTATSEENSVCSLEATPRTGTCPECRNFTLMTCSGDNRFYEEGPHRIFIDLIETNCTVQYYVSGGAEVCHMCYHISEIYGDHYCYQIHECSVGYKDVCPMEASLYD